LGESSPALTSLPAVPPVVGAESGGEAVGEDWSTIATDASAGTRLLGEAHLNPGIAFVAVRQPSDAAAIAPTVTALNREERIIS